MRKLVPSNGGALLLSRHERQLNDARSHLRADLRLNALYRTLEKFAHTLIHRAVAASQLGDAKMIANFGQAGIGPPLARDLRSQPRRSYPKSHRFCLIHRKMAYLLAVGPIAIPSGANHANGDLPEGKLPPISGQKCTIRHPARVDVAAQSPASAGGSRSFLCRHARPFTHAGLGFRRNKRPKALS
jgi:hypothetical protein